MKKNLTQKITSWGAIVSLVGIVASPAIVSAAADTDNTTVSATVSSAITVASSGTASFTIVPSGGGAVSSNSDTVTVSTNASAGYVLTLQDADATSNLTDGTNNFTQHTGTDTVPSTLTNGTWGYAVAGAPFDASYSPAESSNSSSTSVWAGVPTSGETADTLRTTGTAVAGEATTVWYAAKADTSQVPAVYSDSVTYTATTQ